MQIEKSDMEAVVVVSKWLYSIFWPKHGCLVCVHWGIHSFLLSLFVYYSISSFLNLS